MPSLSELVQEYKKDPRLTNPLEPARLDVLLDMYARSKGLTIQEILKVNMAEFKKVNEGVSPYEDFLSYLQENNYADKTHLARFASSARLDETKRSVPVSREPTKPRPPAPSSYEINGSSSEGGRPFIGRRKKTRRRKSRRRRSRKPVY